MKYHGLDTVYNDALPYFGSTRCPSLLLMLCSNLTGEKDLVSDQKMDEMIEQESKGGKP